jgi:hypothetical protein
MLDPGKLRGCIEGSAGIDDRTTARELTRVAGKMGALDHERRELISRYAADQMTGDEYIAANRALDARLERLVRAKAKLVTALRPAHHEDFVDASIRQFYATAKRSIFRITSATFSLNAPTLRRTASPALAPSEADISITSWGGRLRTQVLPHAIQSERCPFGLVPTSPSGGGRSLFVLVA